MGKVYFDLGIQKVALVDQVNDLREKIANTESIAFPAELDDLMSAFAQLLESYFNRYQYLNDSNADAKKQSIKPYKLIEKFYYEWLRIIHLVGTIQLGHADLAYLRPVLQSAVRDLGIEYEALMIVPEIGQLFSTRYVGYAPRFVSFEIPIYSLQSPWEWSILWHEAAGLKIKRIKNQSKDNKIGGRDFFESAFRKLNAQLKTIIGPSYETVQRDWNEFWRTKHFEELIEDAVSVKQFGVPFLMLFEHILEAYAEEDREHPLIAVRLRIAESVAYELARNDEKLKDELDNFTASNDGKPALSEHVMAIEKEVARVIVAILQEPFFQPLEVEASDGKIDEVKDVIRESIIARLKQEKEPHEIMKEARDKLGEIDTGASGARPEVENRKSPINPLLPVVSSLKTLEELNDFRIEHEFDLGWATGVQIKVVSSDLKRTVKKWWLKPQGTSILGLFLCDLKVEVVDDPSTSAPYAAGRTFFIPSSW